MKKIPFYDFIVKSFYSAMEIASNNNIDYDFDFVIDPVKGCCEVIFYVLPTEKDNSEK